MKRHIAPDMGQVLPLVFEKEEANQERKGKPSQEEHNENN